MKKKTAALVLVPLALTFGIAACSPSVGGAVSTTPMEAPPTAPATENAVEPAPAEPEATPGVLDFGKTWEYEDGLAVSVKAEGTAVAGEYAIGAESTGGEVVVFSITVRNEGSVPFDAEMAMPEVIYGDSGAQAEEVFDETWGESFSGKVLPGKKQTVTNAFAVPASEADDVTVFIAPDWDHEQAVFSGDAR